MRVIAIMLVLLATSACSTPGGQGHSHQTDGRPILDITARNDSIELFVKYAALVAGFTSTFEIYITKLTDYQPIDSLKVTVSLIMEGKGIRHSVDGPNKNGVYLPALIPDRSGGHRLLIELNASEYQEKIDMGEVEVYKDAQEIPHAVGDDSGITFTKKQSWEIDFNTGPVTRTVIFDVVNTSGVWEAAPGDSKTLVANSNGIVNYHQKLLTQGATVKKGQPLMTISSRGLTTNNLEVEIEKARADHNQITAEYERKKVLYESNLISKAEWERSESKYLVSKASIEALQQGYKQGGKEIQVPFDGFVRSIDVHNGDYVSQGTELFTVAALNSQILETQISPSYAITTEKIHDIWFKYNKDRWSSMKQSGGAILSIGQEVSHEEPLLPIYAMVNTANRMPRGSFTEVQIGIGNGSQSLVVPETALLEDYGKYSVMVQISGELYRKRPISIGKRNGTSVEVTRGLKKGEIVVTKGAYRVKMASMGSNVPAHGHEH